MNDSFFPKSIKALNLSDQEGNEARKEVSVFDSELDEEVEF